MNSTLHEEVKNLTLQKLADRYKGEVNPHKKLIIQHALLHATKKQALEKGKTQ